MTNEPNPTSPAHAYLQQAHETAYLIESPHDRAQILGMLAVRFQRLGDSNCLLILGEIKQTLNIVKSLDDDEAMQETWLRVAQETLDPELIEELPIDQRDILRVKRAAELGDPELINESTETLNQYYSLRASKKGDVNAAYLIKDPSDRCHALLSLARRAPSPELAEFYREEAWAAIGQLDPEDRPFWQKRIATDSLSLHFMDRIKDPNLRITTLRELVLYPGRKPSEELLTAVQNRMLYELSKKALRPEIQAEIVMLMYRVASRYKDKAFAELIPDVTLRRRSLQIIQLAEDAANNNESIAETPEDVPGRSRAIVEVVNRTGNLALALCIPEQHLRLRAMAGVAAKNNDHSLREEVFEGIIGLMGLHKPEENKEYEEYEIIDILHALQDGSIAKRLLEYPDTTGVISGFAIETTNVDLTLALPAGPDRDHALKELALKLNQPNLAINIDDAYIRTLTYLGFHEKTIESPKS